MVEVLKTGFYSTIQDLGRFGFRGYGVPLSGVMDAYSSRFANAVLNNSRDAAVLEMTMQGVVLRFLSATAICISGAEMSPRVNGIAIKNNGFHEVHESDVLEMGVAKKGLRAYLAVSGGFQTNEVMGSKGMYANVTEKTVVDKGMLLPILRYSKEKREKYASVKYDVGHLDCDTLDVYEGPEFQGLSENQKHALFTSTFTISKHNNRMAYQLNEHLEQQLPSIITSLVLPGTIQVTPSGRLIILMRDCQTTGGYPRILQLTENAINKLSQKFTNNSIRFNKIDGI